jgi:hypothetical protein
MNRVLVPRYRDFHANCLRQNFYHGPQWLKKKIAKQCCRIPTRRPILVRTLQFLLGIIHCLSERVDLITVIACTLYVGCLHLMHECQGP